MIFPSYSCIYLFFYPAQKQSLNKIFLIFLSKWTESTHQSGLNMNAYNDFSGILINIMQKSSISEFLEDLLRNLLSQ